VTVVEPVDHSLALQERSPLTQVTSVVVEPEAGRVSLSLPPLDSLARVVVQVLVPQVHVTELAGRVPESYQFLTPPLVLSSQITN
jgi:hypothetical protein